MFLSADSGAGMLRRVRINHVSVSAKDAGNLVELDTPGASALSADLRAQLVRLQDMRPQSEENLAGRLTP